jgi:FKBP-type peptidyl-prolyl cis-trans isomerase
MAAKPTVGLSVRERSVPLGSAVGMFAACLQVIPGWEQGILGNEYIPAIKEGGARTLLVPPELAYGSLGDGCLFGLPESCRIPPNSPVEITFKYRGLGY